MCLWRSADGEEGTGWRLLEEVIVLRLEGGGEIGVRCCCGKTVGPLAVVVVHAWCVCMV